MGRHGDRAGAGGAGRASLGSSDATPHAFGLYVTNALYQRYGEPDTYQAFAQQQLNFALGANAWGSSFVVGAGTTFPHCMQSEIANLAGSLDGKGDIQLGAAVDGPSSPANFTGLGTVSGMRACQAGNYAPFDSKTAAYEDNVASLPAFSAVVLAGGATAAVAAAVQAAPAASTALTVNWYESAPYYSTLDSNAPNVGQVMSATGQKAFDMAFILANGGSCSPSWDASDPVSSDTQVAGVISQIRSAGGDVIVSAGGYNGTKLGQVCGSASATAAAYQQVITTYGLHAIDLDLEEPEIENSTAIGYELGAARIL